MYFLYRMNASALFLGLAICISHIDGAFGQEPPDQTEIEKQKEKEKEKEIQKKKATIATEDAIKAKQAAESLLETKAILSEAIEKIAASEESAKVLVESTESIKATATKLLSASEISKIEDNAAENVADQKALECKKIEALNVGGAFESLSTQFAGDTTLVSSEIFTGFSAWSDGSSKNLRSLNTLIPRALGIRATSAVAADTSSESDVGNASLLLKDGALVSLTFSLMGSPYWSHYYSKCGEGKDKKWARAFSTDRLYIAKHPVIVEQARSYVTHGLTLKAIKHNLVDNDTPNESDNNSDNSLNAAATFYFGVGFDGPIGLFGDNIEKGSKAGTIDLQVGWKYTKINETALQEIYNDSSISLDSFESIFATLRLQVTDKFFLDIEHVNPRGSAAQFIEEVTSFRLGYGL